MPAGTFSEAERAPYLARAMASIAREREDHALTRAALEHYAEHCEERALEERHAWRNIATWRERAERARQLAKEYR
jgi:hypothetical protein